MPLSVARSQNEATYIRLRSKPAPKDIQNREKVLSLAVDMSFTILADKGQRKS